MAVFSKKSDSIKLKKSKIPYLITPKTDLELSHFLIY